MAKQASEVGKAIVDCGATESLGGVRAIERLIEILKGKDEQVNVTVDLTDRPWYSFGNGAREQVLSRVTLPISVGGSSGKLNIHALEKDNVPILLSISALRALGAVIDFGSGKAVFTEVDPSKVIQLERASSGHFMIDLTQDLLLQQTSGIPKTISNVLSRTPENH